MSGKFFVDTNVLVYSIGSGRPEHRKQAEDLPRTAQVTGSGVISYQVLQEFANVAGRKLQPALTPAEIRAYLSAARDFLDVVGWSWPLFSSALQIFERYRIAWYDSLIVAAALAAGSDMLYTEDMQHGQLFEGTLQVVNPFAPAP